MKLSRLLTRPVEVTTTGEGTVDDDYGTAVPGAPSTVTVLGYVEQASTDEKTVGQQTAPARWWAVLPAGTAVAATSTIVVPDSGQRFEVVGAPAARWDPRDRAVEFVRVELAERTA